MRLADFSITSSKITLVPGVPYHLVVTIPASATANSLEFSCHLPGHYEAGMKLPVKLGPVQEGQG